MGQAASLLAAAAAVGFFAPAAAQAQQMLVYPAMLQDGDYYAIRADDQGTITKCQRVSGGPVTPQVEAACAALIAKGVPAAVQPAKSLNDPATWITPADYPKTALRKRVSGAVEFLFEVNVQGRVSDCAIYATTGSDAIDRAVCAAIKAKARFSPATYQGKPVPAARIDRARMWIP